MENKPEGGTVVFVLGLLGLLMCQVLGIVAWIMGNTYMAKCREMNVAPEGIAVAGRILGIISTCFLAISLFIITMLFSMKFIYPVIQNATQPGMEDLINSVEEANGR